MEHRPIRYQPFRHVTGMDLCCKCGERWYLRTDRRGYIFVLTDVAKHFNWKAPPLLAEAAELTKWLHDSLPSNLVPKGA